MKQNPKRNPALVIYLLLTFSTVGCSFKESTPAVRKAPESKGNGVPQNQPGSKPAIDAPQKRKLVIPTRPTPLPVPGFNDASHVGPDESSEGAMPVTVVLHGNYDRPEWQCAMWKKAAGFYGWVLCPRGVRAPGVSIEDDRWTYPNAKTTQAEIEAGLAALIEMYPDRVSSEGTVLVGFSLGGNYAPWLATNYPGKFAYVFLVEGGEKKINGPMIRALKKAGVRGLGLAMSVRSRRRAAKNIGNLLNKFDFPYVYVDMSGAGHDYRGDFGQTGRVALKRLVDME